MRGINSIPLGCSRLLPVDTVNCVQILKDSDAEGLALIANHEPCHALLNELKEDDTEGLALIAPISPNGVRLMFEQVYTR